MLFLLLCLFPRPDASRRDEGKGKVEGEKEPEPRRDEANVVICDGRNAHSDDPDVGTCIRTIKRNYVDLWTSFLIIIKRDESPGEFLLRSQRLKL